MGSGPLEKQIKSRRLYNGSNLLACFVLNYKNMGLIQFILTLNAESVPEVPEPPPDEILMGDEEVLWGDDEQTFE